MTVMIDKSKTLSGQEPSAEQPADPAGDVWLTRSQAAELLNCSVFKVRTMEGKELHPVQRGGVNFFTYVEVHSVGITPRGRRSRRSHAVDPRTEGQIAAAVFHLLDQGKDLRTIVVEAQVPPERVRLLHREWSVTLADGERTRLRRARDLAQQQAGRKEQQEQKQHEQRMRAMDREAAATQRRASLDAARRLRADEKQRQREQRQLRGQSREQVATPRPPTLPSSRTDAGTDAPSLLAALKSALAKPT